MIDWYKIYEEEGPDIFQVLKIDLNNPNKREIIATFDDWTEACEELEDCLQQDNIADRLGDFVYTLRRKEK